MDRRSLVGWIGALRAPTAAPLNSGAYARAFGSFSARAEPRSGKVNGRLRTCSGHSDDPARDLGVPQGRSGRSRRHGLALRLHPRASRVEEMIRIITADEQGSTVITVDGVLAGESLHLVENCCAEALTKGQPVRLHLRSVSGVDESGRAMLRRLAARRVDMSANGLYSAYIIDEIKANGEGRRNGAR